jgi:DNA-binding CsgD family transcriptional regulator/tetratricopeptide (TPR) repeat protein
MPYAGALLNFKSRSDVTAPPVDGSTVITSTLCRGCTGWPRHVWSDTMGTTARRSETNSAALCPVMVGRDEQLAQLQGAWRAAGQMLLVRGAAGIGKSRLVREFADWARAMGAPVLAGRCSPAAADVPFRPLREALLAASRTGLRPSSRLTPFLPALGSLVPEWVETREAISDGGSIVLAEGMLRLMVEWSVPGAPALLIVEDMHWSDHETIKAVDYLADNLAGHSVVVVLTLRDGEPGAGTHLMDGLLARRVVQPVVLDPLEPTQAEAMVRGCSSASALASHLVDVVASRSDGVPFFIEELLATALENAMSPNIVPPSIGVAIETRLNALPDATVKFLRYAAVLGRQFDWHVVAAALRCPPEDAIHRLRQATRAQLIDTDGGEFRFRHALTVDAVQSSLLPEQRQAACASLLTAFETIHPDLEGWTCQIAANLAFGAGDRERSADLWLVAARRAMAEGWLESAEALAQRAQGDRPVEADRVLLATWALAGQPQRALEAGHRILSSDADTTLATEVRFDLVDAMIAAGRWDDAENYLETLRSASDRDRSHEARLAIGEAEVALGRNDKEAALDFARSALADAQDETLAEVTCRALWVIGRVERGKDTSAASAAFTEAYECAAEHGLSVQRIKSQQELATIGMYETLAVGGLEEVRRDALAAGALSITAMVDLALAATYSCRGQAKLTLEAATRCEEMSRRFDLASLPMSLALQAVAHGYSGNRAAMDAAAGAARATRGDRDTVAMVTLGNGAALFHLGAGQVPEALGALDRAMDVLRAAGGGAHEFPGRWALLRTVVDDGGAAARDECRSLGFDTAMGRATLWAADAVGAGREGGDADSIFDSADQALGRFEFGFLRSIARLLVAPCAYADGWGDPAAWLREALVNFEDLDLSNFAGQCRAALRAIGEPVPRRARSEASRVPSLLVALGVTAREAEVLAQVAAGRTNRQIAEILHLSVRTVEKHVERLIMKTSHSRSELARLAESAGIPPTV